jgi:hypothetical protein
MSSVEKMGLIESWAVCWTACCMVKLRLCECAYRKASFAKGGDQALLIGREDHIDLEVLPRTARLESLILRNRSGGMKNSVQALTASGRTG